MITTLTPSQWEALSEEAHLICFEQARPKELDRLDFALIHEGLNGVPTSYMTCREHDAETIYLQHGGKLPSNGGTLGAFKGYVQMLYRLKESGYHQAVTLIENTNVDMLRIALKVGWKITGVTQRKNQTLVEHTLNLRGFNG